MGPGARKWHQTDREGISYHYHSKLGVVLAVSWRRVFKKKIQGLYLQLYLHYTAVYSTAVLVQLYTIDLSDSWLAKINNKL